MEWCPRAFVSLCTLLQSLLLGDFIKNDMNPGTRGRRIVKIRSCQRNPTGYDRVVFYLPRILRNKGEEEGEGG